MKTNTQTPPERWAYIGKRTRTEYYISDRGHIKTINTKTGEVILRCGTRNKQTGYYQFSSPTGMDYVHRAVARAFCPNPDPTTHTEVHHRNHNRAMNQASNLQWTTPETNRGDHIANRKRSVNSRSTSHKGEVIRAEKWDGTIKFFRNGMDAKRFFCVSHVLVYNCLNGRLSARRCCGWKLKWVPFNGQVCENVEG